MYRDQACHSPAAMLDRAADEQLSLPCRVFEPDLWFADIAGGAGRRPSGCARRARSGSSASAAAVLRREPWGVWGGEIVEGGAVVARRRTARATTQGQPGPPPAA